MGSCLAELLNEAKNTIFFRKGSVFQTQAFGACLKEMAKKDFTVAKPFEIPDLR